LAGPDSHLLDDKQSFMKASHPPILFDPQGLVALHFLSSGSQQQDGPPKNPDGAFIGFCRQRGRYPGTR
jgi:hypothetical protein